MSFSSDVKKELGKINNLANKTQVRHELLGYLISYNTKVVKGNNIRFATESDYNINRFSKLLENLKIEHQIEMEGNLFVINFKAIKMEKISIRNSAIFFDDSIMDIVNKEDMKRAIIRGAFMGSGSISNPEINYHLEITFSEENNMKEIEKFLEQMQVKVKILKKENKNSIYIKDAEEISKILALMGASKSVLKFEDIRIKKEMRSKVNRLVNCETANLTKTINAAVEQIEAIKKLKEQGKFGKLNEDLKEIAILRLENPNSSYEELGEKLKKPLGKSGVNYRLKKIIEISKEG